MTKSFTSSLLYTPSPLSLPLSCPDTTGNRTGITHLGNNPLYPNKGIGDNCIIENSNIGGVTMKYITIEKGFNFGEVFIYPSAPTHIRANGKEFRLSFGNLLKFKKVPKFRSMNSWENWIINHLPKKRLERFLTSVYGEKIKIAHFVGEKGLISFA